MTPTLAELLELWRRASASDRVAFLAHVTSAPKRGARALGPTNPHSPSNA